MANDNSKELFSKLLRLSPQERKVLGYRCQGWDYETIAKTVFISKGSVKTYMDRIYDKLDLKGYGRAARIKLLFEEYCPLLQRMAEKPAKQLPGPGKTNQDEKIPEIIGVVISPEDEKILDEDEYSVVVYTPAPLARIGKEKRGLRGLLIGIIVGVILGILFAVAVYLFVQWQNNGTIPFAPQPSPTIPAPTLAFTSTPIPSNTPLPSPTMVLPSQTPVIQVVVVTATSLPATDVPTMTQPPQPTTLFSDNFEQGLSNAWNVTTGNPLIVNGQLTSDQNTWLIVGDNSWTNYSVQFSAQTANCWFYDNWNAIGVHAQNMDNMIVFKWASCDAEWDTVKNGNWLTIPNSKGNFSDIGSASTTITIAVQDGLFSVYINGEKVSSIFNADSKNGGVALRVGAKTQIDDFKVTAIQ